MENNIKLNFENYLNEKNLTNSQKEIKEKRKMGHITTLL